MKKSINFLTIILLTLIAVIQLIGIGERVKHAMIQTWKFGFEKAFTTMSIEMIIFTYIASTFALSILYFLYTKNKDNKIIKMATKIISSSFIIGLIMLTILILTMTRIL